MTPTCWQIGSAAERVGAANLVVRLVQPGRLPEHEPGVAAAPVVALDLIESGRSRAISTGWRLWKDQLDA